MDLALFEIDVENISRLKAWGKRLMSDLKEEALITLKEENRMSEAMYLVRGKRFYVLGVSTLVGPLKEANPERLINRQHRAILQEVLRPAQKPYIEGIIELIYHLELLED
jgi:hypothetical protein